MTELEEAIEQNFGEVTRHAKLWKPKFEWLGDLTDVSLTINKPHEDYPLRVPITAGLIEYLTTRSQNSTFCNEQDIKHLHSSLFRGRGMNKNEVQRGDWRHYNVMVGQHIFPDQLWVPSLMEKIMPITTDTNIKEWYALFESIHPFEDGNGRIGGIVVAAFSYLKNGRYLTPTQ